MNSVTNKTRLAEKKKTKLQNELNKERKRIERRQKRENVVEEDID